MFTLKNKTFLIWLWLGPTLLFAQTNGIISDATILPPDYDTFTPPMI